MSTGIALALAAAAGYPAVTVLLAAVVLRERIRLRQSLGLFVCGASIGLVALG